MEKIFYAEHSAYPNSERAIEKIFQDFFNIPAPILSRTQAGKPYLAQNLGLFFSVTHTDSLLFIAVSDKEVGIDAERQNRTVNYTPILKKFPPDECEEIKNAQDFIRRWVIRESAVKYLGGTLAKDLKKLRFYQEKLFFNGKELSVFLRLKSFRGHDLSICAQRDFENAEFIRI